MRRCATLAITVLCLTSTGCLSMARRVEQAARRGDERERERPRQVALPQVDPVDLRGVSGHPRLFVNATWPSGGDDVSCTWVDRLIQRATDTLGKPPIPFQPRAMLAGSREALRRISLLAMVYRLTGNAKYADATRRELANVCGFRHWQPDAFLATAEMMTAVSIGYDWLYDVLPPAERRAIAAALVRNGLRPAIDAYDADNAWPTMRNNWNLVCNGGTIVAALAVADEEPEVARRAMDGATHSIRIGLAEYDEHGGTAEGPMYHSYATRYLTFAAAAIESATHGKSSLTHARAPTGGSAQTPLNWLRAGDYRYAMTGPTGKVANFGDCNETLGNTAWILWLTRQRPRTGPRHDNDANDLANFQIKADQSDPSPFDLLWYEPRDDPPPEDVLPLRARGVRPPGRPIVFDSAVVLRDALELPDAAFVAIRTGRTDASHSHLDLGHFVYDVLGERFACDLGADSYDLPGYLHDRRPDYLRTRTAGHNCLTRGDDSQPLAASARVLPPTGPAAGKTAGPRDGQRVDVDLTDAYPTADKVVRTFDLDGKVLTVTDELRLPTRTTFTWHLHTPAAVTVGTSHAILDCNGKRVELRVLEPADAMITAEPDATDPPQLPVSGITHVRVRVRAEKQTTIRVELRPLQSRGDTDGHR